MKAVKGNKEYTIDETQQKFYQDGGFDIVGDDGSVIAYGRGKTVPYEDHMQAVKEIERLREIIAELREEQGEATVDDRAGDVVGEPAEEAPAKAGKATKKASE